jgi:hypothetical protein
MNPPIAALRDEVFFGAERRRKVALAVDVVFMARDGSI